MNKYTSEKTSDKKYYVLFETDEEGIGQYKAASEQERIGTSLTKMRVEGEIVPAIKLEVDKSTYDTFKSDQWDRRIPLQAGKSLHHRRSRR